MTNHAAWVGTDSVVILPTPCVLKVQERHFAGCWCVTAESARGLVELTELDTKDVADAHLLAICAQLGIDPPEPDG